jgi:ABC-type branched-subunit amino acid transport system substrate-binding protein
MELKNVREGIMKRIIKILKVSLNVRLNPFVCLSYFIILILLLSGSLSAQSSESKGKTYTFKLGILYINSPTGERFRDGIKEAIKKYSSVNIFERYDFPYDNETEGLKTLVSLMEEKDMEKKVDIILGPTDSGVFVRALEQRKKLERARIPVISSQVAAKIPHRKGSWFFRTNINVERRAQVIYDFLNKYWVRSIAVLYEDDEFGRRAEEAFHNELRGQQKEHYLPLSYNSTDKARNQIRQILSQRPEAVGIFGDRNDFARLYSLLKNLNVGSSRYRPITFSIIDTRVVRNILQDDDVVYFVSVTDVTKINDFDDVKALACDTTNLVLGELDDLAKSETFNYDDTSWRERFRNHFEAILNGNIGLKKSDSKNQSKISSPFITSLSFENYENAARPRVFKLSEKEIKSFKLEYTISLFGKIWHKLSLIQDRFGFWPIFNIFLIIMIVLFMSIKDIKRWYTGKLTPLFKSLHFLLLLFINSAIALAAYFYLGETGSIRYDSVLTALILALAPSAILRVTLFETSTGKAIGLANYYDSFLRWVHEKLTIKNFLKNQAYINVIAYHNSVYGMKCLLKEIYQNAPGKEQQIRMLANMEEILKEAESWLDRRKALARLLLQKLGWRELADRNFVPQKFKNRKPDSREPLETEDDPENIVIKTARFCAHDRKKRKLIKKEINDELGQIRKQSPERENELRTDHEKDISAMKTQTAIMRKRITFLSLLRGYDPDFLEDLCLSEEAKEILNKAVKYCANKQEKMKVVNKIIVELLLEKMDKKKKKKKNESEKIKKKYEEDMKNDKASFKKKFRVIFELRGCDANYLKANGLLPGEETNRK